VKALKRALSLARILMLPEWCARLIQHLQDPRAALRSALEARSRLLQTMDTSAQAPSAREKTQEALRVSLTNTITDLQSSLALTGLNPLTRMN
jgi:hypothetical protein